MRGRYTWSPRAHPVKMHLNVKRGCGVTVLGAIGAQLPRPVFSLAQSTNKESVLDFFMKLNTVVNPNMNLPRKKVVIVLDNHLAHKTNDVATLAHQFGFELLF